MRIVTRDYFVFRVVTRQNQHDNCLFGKPRTDMDSLGGTYCSLRVLQPKIISNVARVFDLLNTVNNLTTFWSCLRPSIVLVTAIRRRLSSEHVFLSLLSTRHKSLEHSTRKSLLLTVDLVSENHTIELPGLKAEVHRHA